MDWMLRAKAEMDSWDDGNGRHPVPGRGQDERTAMVSGRIINDLARGGRPPGRLEVMGLLPGLAL